MAQLSPLNFRGLLARLQIVTTDDALQAPSSRRRYAIECWKCPECLDVHDDEDDALACCEPKAKDVDNGSAMNCPVCSEKYGLCGTTC